MSISINSTSGITQNNLAANKSCQPLLKSAPLASDTFVSSKQKSNVSFGALPGKLTPITVNQITGFVRTIKKMVDGKLSKDSAHKVNTHLKAMLGNTPKAAAEKDKNNEIFKGLNFSKMLEQLFDMQTSNAVSRKNQQAVNQVWQTLEAGKSVEEAAKVLSPYTLPARAFK
ncbi:MAG: hypothetical protein A2Y25_00655 [Candidatus Melainabacteria bacterium GWF2_37_15]|nr:MAG: hypothetical protein A2Y25_00655 [Candidatus Melainabacteria bacterium GWF2_37_15]